MKTKIVNNDQQSVGTKYFAMSHTSNTASWFNSFPIGSDYNLQMSKFNDLTMEIPREQQLARLESSLDQEGKRISWQEVVPI